MKSTCVSLFARLGKTLQFAFIAVGAMIINASDLAAADATPVYRWTTFAGRASTGYDDGTATDARFNSPQGIAIDAMGNLYVADTANHTIRKISASGVVTTFAGTANQPGSADGLGAAARFLLPQDVAVDASGNVYVADTGNHTIRKITPQGAVTTLAGQAGQSGSIEGPVAVARFTFPSTIFADNQGNAYVASAGSLRKISSNGTVEAIALGGSLATPSGQQITVVANGAVAVGPRGEIYFSAKTVNELGVTVTNGKRIVRRDPTGSLSIVASADSRDGKPYISESVSEVRMTTDQDGNLYFVTQLVSSIIEYTFYKISADGSTIEKSLLQGAGRGLYSDAPKGLAVSSSGKIYHTNSVDDVIFQRQGNETGVFAGILWSSGGLDGTSTNARFAAIAGISFSPTGELFVADSFSGYAVHSYGGAYIRKVTMTGQTSTFSGYSSDRPPGAARGIAVLASGNIAFGTDYGRAILSEFTPSGVFVPGQVENDFYAIRGMAANSQGQLFVADYREIYRRTIAGTWDSFAGNQEEAPAITDGNGSKARFSNIYSLAFATSGDAYVLDQISGPRVALRKITSNGDVTTVRENLILSSDVVPTKLSVDAKGDFILSYNDDTIRLLTASGTEFIIGGKSHQSGVRDGIGQNAEFYAPGAITSDAQNNLFVADNAGVTIRKGEFLGYNSLISNHPQSITAAAGATAQFSVTASGTPAPSYQWQFNGAAISGATSITLTLSNVSSANAGSYAVVVTNTLGSITSNSATLTVTTSGGGTTNPPPASGGGGGGSPSLWFLAALFALGARRILRSNYALSGARG